VINVDSIYGKSAHMKINVAAKPSAVRTACSAGKIDVKCRTKENGSDGQSEQANNHSARR